MFNDSITVSQFNLYIKQIFEAEELLHNIKVEGEVFDVSVKRNCTYFRLKDENASLSCVSFASLDIKEGDKVLAQGSPNYYHKAGVFNFVVNKIEKAGLGELFRQFVLLKEKLQKEGLFDESHKIAIKKDAKRIGVITSKQGAVIHDITNIVWRRNKSIDIVLCDCKVQGTGCENDIARCIKLLDDYDGVDMIILARGGGSLQDLWGYNTEVVARAIFDCKKPIISAVGHETDFTIADFVADLRAPTPSASAELVSGDFGEKKTRFDVAFAQFRKLLFSVESDFENKLFDIKEKFVFELENVVTNCRHKQVVENQKFANLLDLICTKQNSNLRVLQEKFVLLNPNIPLEKGFAKVEKNGKKLGKNANVGDEINIYTKFAKIDAKIQKVDKM